MTRLNIPERGYWGSGMALDRFYLLKGLGPSLVWGGAWQSWFLMRIQNIITMVTDTWPGPARPRQRVLSSGGRA